jgi:hypothetical protein
VISPKKKRTAEAEVFGNVAQARMWYLSLIDRFQKAVGDIEMQKALWADFEARTTVSLQASEANKFVHAKSVVTQLWKFIWLAHEIKYPTYPAVLADILARQPEWPPPSEMGPAQSKKAAVGRNSKSSTSADLGEGASVAGTLNDKDKDLQGGAQGVNLHGRASLASSEGYDEMLTELRATKALAESHQEALRKLQQDQSETQKELNRLCKHLVQQNIELSGKVDEMASASADQARETTAAHTPAGTAFCELVMTLLGQLSGDPREALKKAVIQRVCTTTVLANDSEFRDQLRTAMKSADDGDFQI